MNHYVAIGFAVYMGLAVVSYAVLLLLSFRADRKYRMGAALRGLKLWNIHHGSTPAVTVLAPAKNEEPIISDCVKSFLKLDYPNLSLVVVDDGSTDKTFAILEKEYKLVKSNVPIPVPTLRYQPILSVWVSSIEPRLTVVKKVASHHSKGDANNAGLEIIKTPLVFTTDIDSVVEPDAISKMVIYMEETKTVAVGCPLRPLNGVQITNGAISKVTLPSDYWSLAQVAEYERTFQLRLGWASLGMLNNISGAAGLFQVAALRKIGGYRPDTTAEDLASTFGFHMRNMPITIEPSVNVYTQVPDSYRSIRSQRKRWARGILDILWERRAITNPWKHGRFAVLAIWLWVFEIIEPFIEALGLAFIGAKLITDGMPLWGWLLLAAGLFTTIVLSSASIFQRQRLYARLSWRATFLLAAISFLEIAPFKIPLAVLWRMVGTIDFVSGDTTWEPLPRQKFTQETTTCVS